MPESDHDVNSVACWCRPEILKLCHECEADAPPVKKPDPSCWACGGRGLVPVSEADIELTADNENREPWIIVHNDVTADA